MNVGQLFVTLGMSISGFLQGIQAGSTNLKKFGREMTTLGQGLVNTITQPLMQVGRSVLQVGGDFEAAMNRAGAATGAQGQLLADLTAKAKEMGATTQYSAVEAATAIEMLAKNGVPAKDILGGMLEASLKLASATGSDLARAADITTDAMANFRDMTGNAKGAVDGIVATTLESKFGIEDYAAALAQAGGKAGSVGVSFQDFNTVIAATSSRFASGSDAGTSFGNFLTRLVPKTDPAIEKMRELGIITAEGSNQFFTASGEMRSMGEIAGILAQAFGGLSEQQRIASADIIFGQDAMRTAFGLADIGAEKFTVLGAKIGAQGVASEQAAARQQGYNAAMERLNSAVEGLFLAIGESGLLSLLTRMADGLTAVINVVADLPRPVLAVATAFGVVAAGAGPLVLALGTVASAMSKGGALYVGFTVMIEGMHAVQRALIALRSAFLLAFGLGTGGIVALVVAAAVIIIAKWDAISNKWEELKDDIADNYKVIKDNLKDMPVQASLMVRPFAAAMNGMSVGVRGMRRNIETDTRATAEAFKGATATVQGEMPKIGNAIRVGVEEAGKELKKLRKHLGDGLDDMMAELQERRDDIGREFGTTASRFAEQFGGELDLKDQFLIEMGLLDEEVARQRQWAEGAGKLLGEALEKGYEKALEPIVPDTAETMRQVTQAIEDEIHGSGFQAVWNYFGGMWENLRDNIGDVVGDISRDLADAFVNGDDSLAGILERTGRRILAAGIAALIQEIINKIIALIAAAFGNSQGGGFGNATGALIPIGGGGTGGGTGGGGTGGGPGGGAPAGAGMREAAEQIERTVIGAGGWAAEFGIGNLVWRLIAEVGVANAEEALAVLFSPTSSLGQLTGNLWEHVQTLFGGQGFPGMPTLGDLLEWIVSGFPGGIGGGPDFGGWFQGGGGHIGGTSASALPSFAGAGLAGGITFINQGNMTDRNEVGQWVRQILFEQGLLTDY